MDILSYFGGEFLGKYYFSILWDEFVKGGVILEWTTHMEGGGTLYFRDDGGYVYFEGRKPDLGDGLYKIIIEGLQGRKELGTMLPVEGGLKLTRMVSRQTLGQWGCLPVLQVVCEKVYGFTPRNGGGQGENPEISQELGRETQIKGEVSGGSEWVYLEEEPFVEIEVEQGGNKGGNMSETEEWMPVEEGFCPVDSPEKGVWDASVGEKFSQCSGVLRENTSHGFVLAVPFVVNQEFPVMSLFCFSTLQKIGHRDFLLFYFGKDGKPRFPT